MSKKILISGGRGFLGGHLVDRLIKEGHQVTVVDNEICSGKYQNPQATYIKMAIEDYSTDELYDEAYHLASPASPKIYAKYPLITISANTFGLIKIIGLAKKVLFASSSEIYGNPLEHPQRETYWGNVNTMSPRSCYDEAKRLGETICYEEAEADKDIRVVRIFNTYGPKMNPHDGRVIINFIEQIKKNEPLTIYGDGRQTRSFCYVDDMIEGLIRAMELGKSGEVYNLGNPEEITIKELARFVAEVFVDDAYPMRYLPLPKDEPIIRCPDISKARKELKWRPKISLRQGLELLASDL